MSRYEAQADPLCYPGSQVLQNKADLRDQNDLDQFEQLMFLTRADEPLPDRALDDAHLKALHRHFFQDVYAWAGTARTIRTGKGGNWFCYPEFIAPQMDRIFADLAAEAYLTQTADKPALATRAAYYLSQINAVHPFREGNDRCQLAFLFLLLDRCGFYLDETKIAPAPFMAAMVASFQGNLAPLAQAILSLLKPAQSL